MTYLEVAIEVASVSADEVGNRLLAAGFPGLVLSEAGPDEAPSLTAVLKVYIPDIQRDERLVALKAALVGMTHSLWTKDVQEEDWAESWKRFWHVQHVGEGLVVRPTWEAYDPADREIVVVLDPKQAFGTGTHATTRLCMVELEKRVRPRDRVYDVGTGSGILAIVALLLDARYAEGVDNDSVAIEAARENVDLNRVSERCGLKVGTADDLIGTADIVVANILAEVIIGIAPRLVALTGRELIVSGIIARKAPDVRTTLEAEGMRFVAQEQEGDWVVQVFARR